MITIPGLAVHHDRITHSKRLLRLVAAGGALACLIGTLAAVWAATGSTPAWVFGRFGALGALTTKLRALGIPIEFFGFLGFLFVFVAIHRTSPAQGSVTALVTFALSVVVSAVAGWIAWEQRFRSWTATAACGFALVLIVASAAEDFPNWHVVKAKCVVLLTRWRVPEFRARVALVILGVTSCGALLHASLERFTPEVAAARAFLNWYTTQTPIPDHAFTQTGVIRVVAFTDYGCQFCASGVPWAEALVADLSKETGRRIDFIPRDYPLARACNPAYEGAGSMFSCDASAAVRLVSETLGGDVAVEVAGWFYASISMGSAPSIEQRLAELGLTEAFSRHRDALIRRISEEARAAAKYGISATPTFVVNGVVLPGGASFLETALRHETQRQ